MKKKYIVVMDVPGIKKYVFGTDRLVEIRGASALLTELNENRVPALLMEALGKAHFDLVFSGGGAGQFIIEAELSILESAMKAVQSLFSRESKGGLKVLFGISEYNEDNYAQSLDRAFIQLKKMKDEKPLIPCTLLHTGFVRECDSCAGMGSQYSQYADETRLLCDVCATKVHWGKKKGLWKHFSDFLRTKDVDLDQFQRPKTFEEIGECSRGRKGYTALIYADGNAMGKLIKQIKNKSDFQFFSQVVDEAITQACHEALYENCLPVRGVVPANILLLGGDDLLVYMSADHALQFAIEVSQKFTEKTQNRFSQNSFFNEILNGKGLTVSLGISYAKTHSPFSHIFSQAEELLTSAKQAGSKDPSAQDFFSPSYIDFHITPQFNHLKVRQSRNNFLQKNGKNLKLYQKPYALEDAQSLLGHARQLLYANIPRTRLKRLGYTPFEDKMNGTLDFLKLYTRSQIGEQRTAIRNAMEAFGCVPNMPWKEPSGNEGDERWTTTMITDLMEIAQFCNISTTDREGWDNVS